MKGISNEDFLKNCLEELSKQFTSERPMIVLENYPVIHLGGLSNRFYRNSVLCFREHKPFVLKIVFSHTLFRHA